MSTDHCYLWDKVFIVKDVLVKAYTFIITFILSQSLSVATVLTPKVESVSSNHVFTYKKDHGQSVIIFQRFSCKQNVKTNRKSISIYFTESGPFSITRAYPKVRKTVLSRST